MGLKLIPCLVMGLALSPYLMMGLAHFPYEEASFVFEKKYIHQYVYHQGDLQRISGIYQAA
jgi:hypothetical protein